MTRLVVVVLAALGMVAVEYVPTAVARERERTFVVPIAGGAPLSLPAAKGLPLEDLAFNADGSALLATTTAPRSTFTPTATLRSFPLDGDPATVVRRFPETIAVLVQPGAERFATVRLTPRSDPPRFIARGELTDGTGAFLASVSLVGRRELDGIGAVWSPTGQALAFVRGESVNPPRTTVMVLDGHTGRVRRRLTLRSSRSATAPTADGATLVAGSGLFGDKDLAAFDVATGARRALPGHRGHEHDDLAASPAAPLVALIRPDDTGEGVAQLELVDLRRPQVRARVALPGAESVAWTPDGRALVVAATGARTERVVVVPVQQSCEESL